MKASLVSELLFFEKSHNCLTLYRLFAFQLLSCSKQPMEGRQMKKPPVLLHHKLLVQLHHDVYAEAIWLSSIIKKKLLTSPWTYFFKATEENGSIEKPTITLMTAFKD